MPHTLPGTGLRGRRGECESLDRLLEDVRSGQSRVLVVRGEAGVGKTALLQHLLERASQFRVTRGTGIESEMELAFAGLQQICSPFLGRIDRLPAPQRDALGVAFGQQGGAAPDHYLVGLATLSLLAEVAGERPLLCVVDDAHWLDDASAQVLAFVARRLLAESVGIVFGERERSRHTGLQGLPEMNVVGLNYADSRALLESAVLGRLDDMLRDRIIAESGGNPLALLEWPLAPVSAELTGGLANPGSRHVSSRIEQGFALRLKSLPPQTRRLLLVAAAEPLGDVGLLWRAAERLGIGTDAAAPAEASGLITFGARVLFRHPLVRSAVYGSADPIVQREIHAALAEGTDPESDPDRRAWHRAKATVGSDEAVAAELERSAARAQGRGGIAAAAAFLERATELTPDSKNRGGRALAAARARFEAAMPDAAHALLAVADMCQLDPLQRARLAHLRAQIAFARRRGNDAPSLLLEAARRLEGLDDEVARETYLEALAAAIFAGRLQRDPSIAEVAQSARSARAGSEPRRSIDLLLEGIATRFTAGSQAALPVLRRAIGAFREEILPDARSVGRWLSLCPIAQEVAAHELWDDESWRAMATRAVLLSRETGALTSLPLALVYHAGVCFHAGDFTNAAALIEEADTLTAATGNASFRYAALVLVAWRGVEAPALQLIESDRRDAISRGEGGVLSVTGYATSVLYNGLGRYEAALAGAQHACEYEDLAFHGWSLVELIEAAVRSGAGEAAATALRQLEDRILVADTHWAFGMLARSRALLSEDEAAEARYQEAIEHLTQSRMKVHLARAHLIYGEWLRRAGRRADARGQLRTAYQLLTDMGAEAFAERARGELLATGEAVQKRATAGQPLLTAQEAQVARLAAEGRTNPEIGSQLYISPRTAEYHLHKVYMKLGIKSRRALRSALRNSPHISPPL